MSHISVTRLKEIYARLEQLEALPRWNDAIIQEYELLHCEIDNTTMDYVNSIMDRVACNNL